MTDERALIARLESATPEEMMQMLRQPSIEEESAYRAYLGDERYQRMHVMALRRASTRSADAPRGNVVVIHGIMGAELTALRENDRADHIWARFLRLAMGAMGILRLDEEGRKEADPRFRVSASGIMKRYYGELAAFLTLGWRTEAFWFDWRKDLNLAAAALEEHLARWFAPGDPVHIVAHSMGGLVARTFMMNYPQRWEAMWDGEGKGRRGGRLIMLGTPNHGSFAVPQIITGLEGTMRKLALLDLRHSRRNIQDIANSFVGSYQMLPSPLVMEEMEPLYRAATYGDLRVPQHHLDNARRHHEKLAGIVDGDRMLYIAGYDQPTFETITDLSRINEMRAYRVTMEGDGRVPHKLGALDGVSMYYVKESHGELSTNRQVFRAVQDLLSDGRTDALPTSPPATRAVPDQEKALRELEREQEEEIARLEVFVHRSRTARNATVPPTYVSSEERVAEEIVLSGWLSSRAEASVGPVDSEVDFEPPELRLQVVLAGIQQVDKFGDDELPVDVISVGHYHGVKPVAAAEAIDRAISAALRGGKGDGRQLPESDLIITQLAERGTIRGDLGHTFFLPDYREHRADGGYRRLLAIAGMGLPGRLGSPELTVLVRELAWTLGRMGQRHLATVLIGSGNGNLTIEDAVSSWIRGLKHAMTGGKKEGQLQKITFVEYHPGRVIDIDHFLIRNKEQLLAARRMVLHYDPLTDGQVDQLRNSARKFEQAQTERQWRDGRKAADEDLVPTRITLSLSGSTYRFGAITATAAVPEREVILDRKLVESANDELAGEWDLDQQKERGAFLERLLFPADFRAHLTGSAPIVMLLDATTARIHWEMAAQPDAPPATTGSSLSGGLIEASFLGTSRGLTRQLRTTFAPPPEPPPPPRRRLRVLVIADPAEDARLPGAEEEGAEVSEIFELFNSFYQWTGSSAEVVRLLGPREATRTRVLKELLLRNYDVLHFSGHCSYDPDNSDRSGWIFSGGSVLSANELNRIDRIPGFIFSNACESGITPDRSGLRTAALAPSFAEAFFQRGVVNFVCTAWPIDDYSARLFALTVYGRLLGIDVRYADGKFSFSRSRMKPMHVAMREARLAIAETPGGGQSWGAYQHYGNPNFRLFAQPEDQHDAANMNGAEATDSSADGKQEAPRNPRGRRR